ncbi:hypothetical protein [Xanthomonas phaseoli]|uniref:Uncharacterized protein n=1 Tax=Xanthomonas manihotis TaxID=43353 RepID=A0A8I2BRG3_XANMN|nr:hypothetical protein [Xanthomonas phaseoli]RWU13360.1 hypothetical protein XANMN_22120 [Xanthomonas phaseoli pv. manihotis str. CIO151]KUF31708.1 hypothetical protein AO826_21585 [Xanthomonas phaseoli pv. manihotis]MBO9722699.1 hypothetical protein [Xanthomonas phaseoli pv. manihotis]MBO9757370.1 hypothetical protein [Xanthomonas phaseoli pv. manihotis]MBO9761771.1 hypothetical protein [Xanthomonas phaseoli pv. manihotis]
MAAKIKNFVPCDGWYYTATGSREEPIVFKLAGWATLEDEGTVVGMISASDVTTDDNVARLATPPPIRGRYLPEELLTDEQKAAAKRG